MAKSPKKTSKLSVETIVHEDATRTNIPTAEMQPVVRPEDQRPVAVTLARNAGGLEDEKKARNRDLDPQLVWKGKDEQDWSDLVVQAPPIYIQDKVHPKHLIDDLVRQTEAASKDENTRLNGTQLDLFADFNGLPSPEAKTVFYQHDAHWQNRMILGDSLQVMASLAEREGLRGKVQCIYFDPPYGIKFNSNFQWSTRNRDVKAEFEYLYDRPYEDKKKVRVAGPFTVESLSPHRMLGVDEDGGLIDPHRAAEGGKGYGVAQTFAQMILDNLKAAGVQQAHKEDRITFTALTGWPGTFCCAEGTYQEGNQEKRAGIFIGPEFGTVARPDLVEAAREAADAGFDVLIACAFNFDAHAGEFSKLGKIPVLKARMNADLHMADNLKNTGKGNLFVIFGEPDITITTQKDQRLLVKVNGVDVFDPSSGKVRSDNADGIACWFIDTDYNGESFFVRHAYFLGQNDPYKSLKTTLKAEIDHDVWATLNSDTSRPFPRPVSNRIAVKVINHLGDEVMKVFKV
jgi:hypothetical protein